MINLGLRLLRDFNVLIFSPSLRAAFQGRFPGIVFGDQRQLFRRAQQLAGTRRPETAIFHHGGISFPVLGRSEDKGGHIHGH